MLQFTGTQRDRRYLATEQKKERHVDKYVPQTEPASLLVFSLFFNSKHNHKK